MPFILISFATSGVIANFIWISNLSDAVKIIFSLPLALALITWIIAVLTSDSFLCNAMSIISLISIAALAIGAFVCKIWLVLILCLFVFALLLIWFLDHSGFFPSHK